MIKKYLIEGMICGGCVSKVKQSLEGSVLDKKKIKCACLGDIFNLPMSTVTIVEDLTMVAMAGIMLFL